MADKNVDEILQKYSQKIEREIKNLETRNDYNKRLDAIPWMPV